MLARFFLIFSRTFKELHENGRQSWAVVGLLDYKTFWGQAKPERIFGSVEEFPEISSTLSKLELEQIWALWRVRVWCVFGAYLKQKPEASTKTLRPFGGSCKGRPSQTRLEAHRPPSASRTSSVGAIGSQTWRVGVSLWRLFEDSKTAVEFCFFQFLWDVFLPLEFVSDHLWLCRWLVRLLYLVLPTYNCCDFVWGTLALCIIWICFFQVVLRWFDGDSCILSAKVYISWNFSTQNEPSKSKKIPYLGVSMDVF